MHDAVRDSYDEMAELYASLFLTDLEHDENARTWLTRIVEQAGGRVGPVADLGCGPGHVLDYLTRQGLDVVGYDLSPGQIDQARASFPAGRFHVGDLAALEVDDASFGGIVSRYSLIHLLPNRLDDVFAEWRRVLESGAPALVSFFGALDADGHGEPFDHKVVTAYALHPATVAAQMERAGFVDVEIGVLPSPEGGRPFDQGTILATKSGDGTTDARR